MMKGFAVADNKASRGMETDRNISLKFYSSLRCFKLLFVSVGIPLCFGVIEIAVNGR